MEYTCSLVILYPRSNGQYSSCHYPEDRKGKSRFLNLPRVRCAEKSSLIGQDEREHGGWPGERDWSAHDSGGGLHRYTLVEVLGRGQHIDCDQEPHAPVQFLLQ